MSRPVRIEFPGAVYHVTSKGSEGQIVFDDADDRGVFLNVLDNLVVRFGWLIHSYVLMDDHYHLVVEVPEANLSKGMRQLNGVYTQHVNRRHAQEGPIFHGRFKSILLEKKNYLLPVCRHVVTNPGRLKGAPNFSSYKWSSYRALAGQVKAPTLLHKAAYSHYSQKWYIHFHVQNLLDPNSTFLNWEKLTKGEYTHPWAPNEFYYIHPPLNQPLYGQLNYNKGTAHHHLFHIRANPLIVQNL